MEHCKKVQVEEYVIHAVESTNFYTHLRFSLLASTWFPRPLGVCLWSALHMLLVLYEALMLLVLFSVLFVLAVLVDAILVVFAIYFELVRLFAAIVIILVRSIGAALSWLWLVITCQCYTMPGQAPGQGLGDYLFAACVMEGGICPYLKEGCRISITRRCVNHLILVSFPYRRVKLGDACGEIVPWYDIIVI